MATYVESVLGKDEQILFIAKVSAWSMLPLFLGGLVLLPVLGLGLILWLMAFIRYKTTELAVTNKKIISKFGFIGRQTIELLLPKVESIEVQQSIFGRMLNYGSISVAGGGNTKAPVPGIYDPLQFRRRFMEIQEQKPE